MTHPDRIPDYLHHMVVATNRIASFLLGKDQDAFLNDLLIQDAVLRQIEVLGEASKRILRNDSTFFERHGLVQVSEVIGMRNRIAHEYLNVDSGLVWYVASVEVPQLRTEILVVLKSLDPAADPESLHF